MTDNTNWIECGARSGDSHAEAKRMTEEGITFDWAYPIDWVIDVQRLLRGAYQPINGHVVTRYGQEDGLCGRMVGLCPEGQAIVDLYGVMRKVEWDGLMRCTPEEVALWDNRPDCLKPIKVPE